MEKAEQAVLDDAGQSKEAQSNTQGQAAKVNLDDLPEFRQYKSNQDKRASELEKRLREEAEARKAIEAQLETVITDPKAKAEFKQQKLEAELERYRAREVASQQRKLFSDEYGVPESIFESTDSPGEMTDKALRYLRQKSQEKPSGQSAPKPAEAHTEESSGEDFATVNVATPPDGNASEIKKKIEELRSISKASGNSTAARKARSDILDLEAQLAKRATPTKARV